MAFLAVTASLELPEADWLRAIILSSHTRRACLRAVRDYGPPDAWLSAGFVRNPVFDALFGAARIAVVSDLDVIYLDAQALDRERDRAFERALNARVRAEWSVKNQARMAVRNGVAPYRNVGDALAHFPETATAVAVRLQHGKLAVLAPHGLADLRSGVLRGTPGFDPAVFSERCVSKRWRERWPQIVLEHA
jgi:hypothetical protein